MRSLVRYRIGGALLELVVGDITDEETDAIVNAANSSLLGGGGVDGAIHRAAGPKLLAECRKLRGQRGLLPPGQAVTTPAGNLKARYVIHTVGPLWNGGAANEPEILKSCYRSSIAEGNRHDCVSLAFPSISTGAFGYPVEAAAKIAMHTMAGLLYEPGSVKSVRFVLFDQHTHHAYDQATTELTSAFPHLQITLEGLP